MIKVLHIVPGFLYGGIESRLIDWYSCVDREKCQFDVLKVTPDQPNALVDRMQELGAEVISIPPLGIKTAFRHIHAVRKVIKNGNYSVVHSHSLAYGFFTLLFAKTNGIKLRILHSRTTSYNPNDKHVFVSTILGKMAIPLATHFFACSEEAGKWAFGNKRRVRVIRNGIFLEQFNYCENRRTSKRREYQLEDAFVLGYVGRFSTQKNTQFLLDILSMTTRMADNVMLVMVGDDTGEVARQFKEKAALLNLTDRIIYVGRQDKIQDWYPMFDVFVAPSLFEGFGTVALEAQANGLPCVLSTGFPTIVKVAEKVHFLSLDNTEDWVKTIMKYHGAARQGADLNVFREAGYDVRQTAKELEQLYASVTR